MYKKNLIKDTSFKKVQYFEGIDGYLEPLIQRLDNTTEIKQIISGKKVAKFHKATGEAVFKNIGSRVEKGIKFKSLINYEDRDLEIEKSNTKALKETRILPEALYFDSMLSIFGDKVAITNLNSDKTIGIIIEDKDIKNSFETLFNGLWNVSKPN